MSIYHTLKKVNPPQTDGGLLGTLPSTSIDFAKLPATAAGRLIEKPILIEDRLERDCFAIYDVP